MMGLYLKLIISFPLRQEIIINGTKYIKTKKFCYQLYFLNLLLFVVPLITVYIVGKISGSFTDAGMNAIVWICSFCIALIIIYFIKDDDVLENRKKIEIER